MLDSRSHTLQQDNTHAITINGNHQNRYSIASALVTIKRGVLLLALAEYYSIQQVDIIGMINSKHPHIVFSRSGFAKILEKQNDVIFTHKNIHSRSIKIVNLDQILRKLSPQKIFMKFPFFWVILDENQYDNIEQQITDVDLINRCISMQSMWRQWGDIGLPHLISSHQALQRYVASKMKNPMSYDFDDSSLIKNGLSIEYQCEIYANHLYGAKLLDIWHYYLINLEPKNRHPNNFLNWLRSLSTEQLNAFDITSLDEIHQVHYITDSSQRAHWQICFLPGNIVKGNNIEMPRKMGDEIEIIYALGKSESKELEYFGGIKIRGTINHSSFFGEEPVKGAGRIILKCQLDSQGNLCWVVHRMDNNSGHIKPNDKKTLRILENLETLGLNLDAIQWYSKWGTVGQRGETAAVALKRLKKDLKPVEINDIKIQAQSKHVSKIADFSEKGLLKELDHYLSLRSHKVTVEESLTVAALIMEALKNNLSMFEADDSMHKAKPKLARALANRAVKFLHNIAITSHQFEKELDNIIVRYEESAVQIKGQRELAKMLSFFRPAPTDDDVLLPKNVTQEEMEICCVSSYTLF